MQKFKIAYVLEKFPSPTEYFILNEILQFEQNGFEVLLLVLRRQKKLYNLNGLKQLKATIHYLPRLHFYFPIIPFFLSCFYHRNFRLGRSFFLSPALPTTTKRWWVSHLLNSLRYYSISQYFAQKQITCDHIHAHFAFIAVDIAYYLSKVLNINYSLSAHAQDIYTNQEKIKQHLPNIQFLITCTEYNKTYLNRYTGNVYVNKIYKVYHGVHIGKWPCINNRINRGNEINLLSIARLVDKKGLIYLIKAVEILVIKGINAHCTIIGEGILRHTLEKYIITKKLDDVISIVPFVPQNKLRNYFSQADMFVLPCIVSSNGDRDGLPNVIVEAMLNGVPVISTSVSAIPEVIIHGKTGILVKERDEQDIAEGIMMIKNDNNLRHYIANNARKLVEEKLDIRSSTNELIQIFSKHIQSFQL